jgi:hypothetical protein
MTVVESVFIAIAFLAVVYWVLGGTKDDRIYLEF